jgi:putative transposase
MQARKFKRCRRYNEPGHAHFLTFTCFRGQPFLSRDRTRQWLADALARACEQHQFHLWAWVFMPEHVHVLVWPTQASYSISAFLTSMKQPVS